MENITDTESMTNDDAAWALTCAFLILTMQTGFAMLECGCVSAKNSANIMIKNVVDVSLGGISYWLFGYGLSFGQPSNCFTGMGGFFFHKSQDSPTMGSSYAHYFFQFSFATTATTIVSGAVAERMKLKSYMLFSFANTLVYCFPAGWAWNTGASPWNETAGFHGNSGGFLYKLKFFDFAGVCVVHVSGGTSALVAAYMLGARKGKFENPDAFKMNSPVTAMTGMFMLWWAWLGFNCGSTFGVSGQLWKITALVAVTTLNGAIGGALAGIAFSLLLHKGLVLVDFICNSILGGLVGITGAAAITQPPEALLVGFIGGTVAVLTSKLVERMQIDDPVGAVAVHMLAGSWGTLVVGIFGRENAAGSLRGTEGLIQSGNPYLLGIQLAGLLIIVIWSAVLTFILLWMIDRFSGLRMSEHDEVLGADWTEHQIRSESLASRLEQVLLGLDERYWTTFIQKLYTDITEAQTQPVIRGHRIFSVDQQSYNIYPKAEAVRELRAILESPTNSSAENSTQQFPPRNGRVFTRKLLSSKISPGMYSLTFRSSNGTGDRETHDSSHSSSEIGTGSTNLRERTANI